jgi:methionyl aminopeptidase
MIHIKTEEDLFFIRKSTDLVSRTLGMLAREVKQGVTPLFLDKLAEQFIRDHSAAPAFKGLYGFPNTLCTSVNEQIVHGIPNNIPLVEGDIISIDCGTSINGYCGDQAFTFAVGEISEEKKQLLKITRECLYLGIQQALAGNRVGDIGNSIQRHAEKHGYGVVRELVGHGFGKSMHEEPEVPNYGKRGKGVKLRNGMTLAIEPMINMGTRHIKQLKDGWTIITADGNPSAHFEHDILILTGKTEILTTFDFVDEALTPKHP